ncbi:MAG TPA: hypothetical protein VJ579_00320 [Candidatus Paceibacterota bacterium]|nr:hypothetical protein [Candidatus Paceibacterota bacterium]
MQQKQEFALRKLEEEISAKILSVSQQVRTARTAEQFFDLTCELYAVVEKMKNENLLWVGNKTNYPVLFLSAVLRNETIQRELIRVTEEEEGIYDQAIISNTNLESKLLIRTSLLLAFMPIAVGLESLEEVNIVFYRKVINDALKEAIRNSQSNISIISVCFKIEGIIKTKDYFHGTSSLLIDVGALFEVLKLSRILCGISSAAMPVTQILAAQFSKSNEKILSFELNLSEILSSVYSSIFKVSRSIEYYINTPVDESSIREVGRYSDLYQTSNEKNLIFFLEKISSDFNFQEGRRFYEVMISKISSADSLRLELVDFATKHLSGFRGDISEDHGEWSNKVFITSLRLLSVLSVINLAKDSRWKVSTSVREYVRWLEEVHGIINKYSLEDDWSAISDFVDDETSEIEWKSTFFTPTEQMYSSKESDSLVSRSIFGKISKTVLGMMNTSGGTILVGLVENPKLIIRADISEKLICKNGKTFYDVGYELSQIGRSLDSVRLQMLENLKNMTDESSEKFNDLFTFIPLQIKSGGASVTIVKIQIKKGARKFYSVKKENNSVWISLAMRAMGQTIDVDVRDYLPEGDIEKAQD